jgi:hypothetical protein
MRDPLGDTPAKRGAAIMTWQCERCGERHDDEFGACWRCVGEDPAAVRVRNEDFDDKLESDDGPEIAAHDAEQAFREQVWAYQRAKGWYPAGPEDRWTAAANALHRLVIAYRLYRDRQERAGRARPDLDRPWLHFFLVLGIFAGVWLGVFTSAVWGELLLANETPFVVFHVTCLFLAIITGKRAVERELHAAAEMAVEQGWRVRVT